MLVIEGRSRQEMEEEQKASWEKITIEEHMEIYENQGHSRKEAMIKQKFDEPKEQLEKEINEQKVKL